MSVRILISIIIGWIGLPIALVYAQPQSTTRQTSAISIVTPGDSGWSNLSPSALSTIDSNFAATSVSNGSSDVFRASGFGFGLNGNTVITGAQLTFFARATGQNFSIQVRLVTPNQISSTKEMFLPLSSVGTGSAEITFGHQTDTWGVSLDPLVTASAQFGIEFSIQSAGNVSFQIDDLHLTLFDQDGFSHTTSSLSGVAVTTTQSGDGSWSSLSPSTLALADNNYTSTNLLAGQNSDTFFVSQYGAAIPSNATIRGVSVGLCGNVTPLVVPTVRVRIGTPTNQSAQESLVPGSFCFGFGGHWDTWGMSLTPQLVNSANFGVFVSVTAGGDSTVFLDNVQITIHYTLPNAAPEASQFKVWNDMTESFEALGQPIADNLPIVVLVHGWNFGGATSVNDLSWMKELAAFLEAESSNRHILAWDWMDEARTVNHLIGFPTPPVHQILYQKNRLAAALAGSAFGVDTSLTPNVHLLGHSLGGAIVARAARKLRASYGVTTPFRVTLFDPPENHPLISLQGYFGTTQASAELQADMDVLASFADTDIDNYSSEFGIPYAGIANVWLRDAADSPNAPDSLAEDHALSYVWYGNTVQPSIGAIPIMNNTLPGTLRRYYSAFDSVTEFWSQVGQRGHQSSLFSQVYWIPVPYEHSIFGTSFFPYVLNPATQPPLREPFDSLPVPTHTTILNESFDDISPWSPGGTGILSTSGDEMHLQTVSALTASSVVLIPVEADLVRFDLRFEDTDHDIRLEFMLNGTLLYATDVYPLDLGLTQNSGMVDIGEWAGTAIQLDFTLRSPLGLAAHVVIDNLEFIDRVIPSSDADADGILDIEESIGDPDGDGSVNMFDLDSDNDSIIDTTEGLSDVDNDGVPNIFDLDSDADGDSDQNEIANGTDPYSAPPAPLNAAAIALAFGVFIILMIATGAWPKYRRR